MQLTVEGSDSMKVSSKRRRNRKRGESGDVAHETA